MTALDQYIRLEAEGRWRETEEGRWREVLVSFGNASLVLSSFSEEPLTHWSLAAVERLGENEGAVIYGPGPGSGEILAITDPQMVEAIAEVSRMARIRARPAPRRRIRGPALALLAFAAIGAAALWGPDFLRARAFALVTPEQSELISERVRGLLGTRVCTLPEGQRSLRRLAIAAAPAARVEVRAWDAPPMTVLSDGTVILSRALVERAASAEAVAGWIALGRSMGPGATPLYREVEEMEPLEVLRFLISGTLSQTHLREMAEEAREGAGEPAPEAVAAAAARLVEARIDPAPFLSDISRVYPGLSVPAPVAEETVPVMPRDQNWIALQEICAG